MTKSDEGDFAVDGPPPPVTHAGMALEAIVAQAKNVSLVPDDDIRDAVAAVSQAIRAIPEGDTLLLPKLALLEKSHASSLAPSKQHPITWKTPLARLLLTLQLTRLQSQPIDEVVAHPAATTFPGAVGEDVARIGQSISLDTSGAAMA